MNLHVPSCPTSYFYELNPTVSFSLLCCQLRRKEVIKLYHSFHVITQKGDAATAVLQLSILVYMPTRLRFSAFCSFFFVRRDKYLDLVKCLMKHEEVFPFKSDLLEQVIICIAA
jgi:hypothetical protein